MADTSLTLNHDASCSCPWTEQLTANFAGKARRETIDGRSYLVATISALVPGVLNGSKGPLMYSPEDTRAAVPDWNGVPIVVYHPTDAEGKPVSAKTDGVVRIGYTRNAGFDDKLAFEGVYDEELTKATDVRVYDALVNGTPMEVSTGLGTLNERAENGSYLGRKFMAYARNHKPDHIAMLPDMKGACSLDDGCGLNVNEDKEQLCTNCSADGECEECKKKRLKKAADDAEALRTGDGQTTNDVTANQLSHDDLRNQLQQLVSERFGGGELSLISPSTSPVEIPYVSDVFDRELVFQHRGKSWRIGYSTDLRSDAVSLGESEPVEVKKLSSYRAVQNRLLLERVGGVLGVNCGGEGGTPGPCPTGSKSSREGLAGGHEDLSKRFSAVFKKSDQSLRHLPGAKDYYAKMSDIAAQAELGKHEATSPTVRGAYAKIQRRAEIQMKSARRQYGSLVTNRVGQNLIVNSRKEADMATGKCSEQDRQKMVDFLVTNEEGVSEANVWNEKDREALNGMSDEQLHGLALQKRTVIDQAAVVNAVRQDLEAGEGSLTDLPGFVRGVALNAKKFPFQKKKKVDDDEEEDDEDEEEGVENKLELPKQLTEAEAMKILPASMRSDLEYARQLQNKEKGELIGQIVANMSGQERDKTVDMLKAKLQSGEMKLGELKLLANCAQSVPAAGEQDGVRVPHYAGAAIGGPLVANRMNGRTPKKEDVLVRNRINWKEVSESSSK